MAKPRVHNEWFRDISLGNRKSCPTCKAKLFGRPIISWGEYAVGKWYTVKHFCSQCAQEQCIVPLIEHVKPCGCGIDLNWKGGGRLPACLPHHITADGVPEY